MNRVIKFRAWDGKNIITPTAIINGKAAINKPCDINDKVMTDEEGVHYYCNWDIDKTTDYPLMQYTGLKDKNGVEIYEGDIVKAESCQHYWLSVVSTDNGKMGNMNLYAMEFCNNVTTCEFEETYTYERQNSTRRNDINTRMEIIGNIHENPELLEVN